MLSLRHGTAVLLSVFCLGGVALAGAISESRVATYLQGTDHYFAMSLSADLVEESSTPREVVVLFDTSASQSGLVRDEQLACLETLLQHLLPEDRVRLVAVDLDAVEFHEGFGEADSPAIRGAVESLRRRSPMGATDMRRAIEAGLEGHDSGARTPRHIVYLGDGISRANLLHRQEFTDVVLQLIEHRVSVSSFAVGPRHDGHLLATLANHTGGSVLISGETISGQQAGLTLAASVHVPVLWPESFAFEPAVEEFYPAKFPPLRADRDSILIGKLGSASQITLKVAGTVAGQLQEVTWNLQPEAPSDEFQFLPQLVKTASRDSGLSLPTVGTEGLLEVSRLLQIDLPAGEEDPAAEDPAATDDQVGMGPILRLGTPLDVSHDPALIVRRRTPDDTIHLTQVIIGEPPFEPGAIIDATSAFDNENGRLVDAVKARQRARVGVLRAEVRTGLAAARDLMQIDPSGAVRDLKVLMESVRRAPDIPSDVRVELSSQLESAIRTGIVREVEKENRDAQLASSRAAALERDRIVCATIREEEQLKQILNRMNSLMDEGRYDLARRAALAAEEIAPREPAVYAAVISTHYTSRYQEMRATRRAVERGFFQVMLSVERSLIPFPDDPPLVYPPADVWEELTARREEYSSVDVASRGEAEKQIMAELDKPTSVEFFETPLLDVMTELSELHGINIELDLNALDLLGVDSGEAITKSYDGISLKSALNLILREFELTYLVRDEVLMITSEDEALTELVTRVYPVGDLVIPIQSGIGVGGGGGIGGGGGGFGGGGGGFGGGGGGGFGGGGGGGAFAVEDELRLSDRKAQSRGPAHSAEFDQQRESVTTIEVAPAEGQTLREAWDRFFQSQRELPRDRRAPGKMLRETIRQKMNAKQFTDVVTVLESALANGTVEPWMFEVIGLALQASGADSSDIERALMSGVDFSESLDQMFYAATYMARVGLESRALKLLSDITEVNSANPEPYAMAMKIARRLDDRDALRWSALGVLHQSWPDEYEDIVEDARRTLRAIRAELVARDDQAGVESLDSWLKSVSYRDCVAKITWSGDADLDLVVEEPTGSVCSTRNMRTTSGGVLSADSSSIKAKTTGSAPSETYTCAEGFSGRYRVAVRPVWGDVTGGKVTVEVTIHAGSDAEQTIKRELEIADEPIMVTFNLDQGRRLEPLASDRVATIPQEDLTLARRALAQQLKSTESPAALNLLSDRRDLVALGLARNGIGIRPAVGFQPVITTLPQGAQMTASAVISADRRYVRVTPTPFFSFIADVDTFNFVTGGGQQTGGAGGVGGGQQGGVGGGGGGAGGGGFGGGGGGGFGGGGGGGQQGGVGGGLGAGT